MRALARPAAEKTTARRLRTQLRPFLVLARAAHALSERALVLRSKQSLDSTGRVQAQLLVQAANQLRLVELAAQSGYPLQALGAASTLYELVSAIGYVDSPEKAAEWFGHTDFKNSFPSSKKRATGIRFMLQKSGVSAANLEALVDSWEEHYVRFCAAKHGNPALLKEYAVTPISNQFTLHIGPIMGPAYALLARIALYHGSRLLADATVLFATPLLAAAAAAPFRRARRDILKRIHTVAQIPALAKFD